MHQKSWMTITASAQIETMFLKRNFLFSKSLRQLLIIAFFLSITFSFGQDKYSDSLKSVIKGSKSDTSKVDAILQLAVFLSNSEPDSAIHYCNSSLKLSENISYKYGIKSSLKVLGIINMYRGNYEIATNYFLKFLNIAEKSKDSAHIAQACTNLGIVQYYQKNYIKSNHYNFRALNIKRLLKSKSSQISNLTNIGDNYRYLFKYDSALFYHNQALAICSENKLEEKIGNVYNNISIVHFENGNLNAALAFLRKAYIYKLKQGDKYALASHWNNMGSVFTKLNRFDSAAECIKKALKLSNEFGSKNDVSSAYEQLAFLYSQKLDYEQAYKYSTLFIRMKDTLFNENQQKQITEMETKYETQKKENDLRLLKSESEKEKAVAEEKNRRQMIIIFSVIIGFLLVTFFAFYVARSLRLTRKQKEIIEGQKTEVEQQKHLVEEKQQEIVDSITYAKRLQEAILPPKEFVNKYITENFIYYQPKDIVAGDFYWAEKIEDLFFIAAADSTGHGVPGAIVSVVCSNALNRTIKEFKLTETVKILDKTRELVIETFEKSESEVKDGMDISLLCIDSKNKTVFWSGANNPLWYIQDAELKEIKADKQPIGKSDYPKPFTTHQIEYKENTTFYLFTDGLADQFGGPNGKKFKYKQFSDLLIKNNNLSPKQQADIINKAFSNWKGDLEQVDDVCVIGIKI